VKPVVTADEAAALDRETQARGVGAAALMERAGWGVARAVLDVLGGAYGRRVLVVCGKGNNGGDGYVAARHLERRGVRTTVLAVEAPAGAAVAMRDRLAHETTSGMAAATPAALERGLGRADAVIDAILGTGFRGEPVGAYAAAIDAVRGTSAPVIAVDIPSGVDATTGAVPGAAVLADLTVTFGAAKSGAVLFPGAAHVGDLRVIDIGFPVDLIPDTTGLTEPADVAGVLLPRAPDAHKKASGTLVVVAGSRAMTGAARLVAEAAGRIGAGYVVVAVPASILPVVQVELTETVFVPLPETADGTIAAGALDEVLARAEDAHAIALGPGLTTHDETASFVRELVRRAPVPVVLDADGLNAFAGRVDDLVGQKADAVLTPHLGELARLVPVDGDRLRAARELASVTGAIALVKGSRTVIAEPGGAARINPTGGAVLATAGTGDVLTGTIGGLLARGAEPFVAAWAGAYVHGLAGLLAGEARGEGVLAGDVASTLPDAVALVRRQA
jgi:NAD(P)H-hydrate epimerase